MSQKFFWKNVSPFGNNCSNFWKNSKKIRPQYGWISKIPSHGRWAWNNLSFTSISFLAPVIFWSIFKISWIKKMARAKKVVKLKNQFFHARQPRKIIFDISTYWGLIFIIVWPIFEQLFLNGETFFQKKVWLKSLLMVNTINGWMGSKIQQKWFDSNVYVINNFEM